jgi:tRNA (guanine37-N1)-methyltransferase
MNPAKIWIMTLFPKYFAPLVREGVVARAFQEALDLQVVDLRPFGLGDYQHVDDAPYGGGPGMIMRPDVLAQALQHIVQQGHYQQMPPGAAATIWRAAGLFHPRQTYGRQVENQWRPLIVIHLAASGSPFTAQMAKDLAKTLPQVDLVFLCGRYEGVDQRFVDHYVHAEISIGDFVLSGGEIAALAVLDATARWLPGVLNNDASLPDESFENNLLEYPQYTRPAVFEDEAVPPVLLSGNHAQIKAWRQEQAVQKTQTVRPDLLAKNKEGPA